MAEIGALANIIGVAGAGVKLSILLFDFASTVGAAGNEINQIAVEISLFCSVLKQLQSTLTKAKTVRYSISAIETTQQILDHCLDVFKEIEWIVDGLRKKSEGHEKGKEVDWVGRVKWTFKRSKIQVLRTTLESCKITLHLMLTTLDIAQKIAARRTSFAETQLEEEEQEQTMTHSLVIAHQCTLDRLSVLEDEEAQQLLTESDNELSLPLKRKSQNIASLLRLSLSHKSARFSNDRGSRRLSPILPKRDSAWLNNIVFDHNSPLPPGFRRQTYGGPETNRVLERQAHYYLLGRWTDREPSLDETPGERLEEATEELEQTSENSKIVLPYALPSGKSRDFTPLINFTNRKFDRSLPRMVSLSWAVKIPVEVEDAISKNKDPSFQNFRPGIKQWESFHLSTDDAAYEILPEVLKGCTIDLSCKDYFLRVVYDKKELLILQLAEQLQALFRRRSDRDERPVVELRKMDPGSDNAIASSSVAQNLPLHLQDWVMTEVRNVWSRMR